MKYFILLTFLLSFQVNFISSQVVDSISVEIYKRRHAGSWDFLNMRTDSLSSGLVNKSLLRHWTGSNWTNDNLISYSYLSGSIANKISLIPSGPNWTNERKWSFSYSAAMDSTTSLYWNSAWINDTLTIAYHDAIGLDTLLLSLKWKNNIWVNLFKQENVFAPDSTYLSQTFSSWDSTLSQWEYTKRYLWYKDSLGNDTGIITQNFITGVWKNYYGIFSSYSGNTLTNQYDVIWDIATGSIIDIDNISTFTYDTDGRLIYIMDDFTVGGFCEIYYTYDTTGILINKLYHYETQGGFVTEDNSQWLFYSFPNSSIINIFPYDNNIRICNNDSVPSQFFAIGGTAPLHFHWLPSSAVDNDSAESPFFIADTSSLVRVIVSDAAGNSITDSIQVNVVQSPVITSVQSIPACIGCNNGMFIISAISGTSSTIGYQITPSAGAVISGDTIKNLYAGVYTICVKDMNYCSHCITDTIFESNVGETDLYDDVIKIFPNPSAGQITIDLAGHYKNVDVIITDAFGREVSRESKCNTSLFDFELKGNSGVYFVKINTGDKTKVYRVLKI